MQCPGGRYPTYCEVVAVYSGLGSSAKQEQTEMCMRVGIRMERK